VSGDSDRCKMLVKRQLASYIVEVCGGRDDWWKNGCGCWCWEEDVKDHGL